MTSNTDPVRAQDYVAVPRAFLEQVYAMAREGCEAPATAYRWCERIDGLFHGGSLDEHDEWARQLPAALASAPPSAPVGVEGFPPDVQEIIRKDEAGWALAKLAELHGAERDESDNGTWWTLRIEHFSALSQQPAAPTIAKVDTGCRHNFVRDEDNGGECCQKCGKVRIRQPAAPGGEAVAWLRMTPDGTPDWAEDCIGSDDKFLDPEMASDGYYLQPLYAAPQQPAGVDEAPTWGRQQPTAPGIYGIRGFNLCRPASEQFEAVVVVREHGGELVCNLHESTSEDDLESWAPICDLDPDFEWRVFVPGWEQQGGRADG